MHAKIKPKVQPRIVLIVCWLNSVFSQRIFFNIHTEILVIISLSFLIPTLLSLSGLTKNIRLTHQNALLSVSNFLSLVLISQISNSRKQFGLSLSLSIPDMMFCSLSLITHYIFRTNLHLLTKVYFLAITFEL